MYAQCTKAVEIQLTRVESVPCVATMIEQYNAQGCQTVQSPWIERPDTMNAALSAQW